MMSMEALLTNPDPVVAAAPVREVELRAAAPSGRAGGAGPRIPPRAAPPARAGVRLGPDGRLVGRGRRGVGAPGHRARRPRAAPRPTRPRWRISRAGSRARRTRCWSPAPTSTPAAAGTRPSRWPSGAGCPCGRRPPPARGASGSPRTIPTSRACCRRRSGPLAQTLEPYDLVLVVGAPVFTYYPYIPGPVLPEGDVARAGHERSAGGRARAGRRRDRGGRGAHARGAARAVPRPRTARLPRRGPAPELPADSSPIAAAAAMAALGDVLPADGHRRERVALEHDRVSQPGAPVAPVAATSRPPAAGSASGCPPRSACSSGSRSGRWSP